MLGILSAKTRKRFGFFGRVVGAVAADTSSRGRSDPAVVHQENQGARAQVEKERDAVEVL